MLTANARPMSRSAHVLRTRLGLVASVSTLVLAASVANAEEVDLESLGLAEEVAPEPLEVDYAQYGVALAGRLSLGTGGLCPDGAVIPCIFGGGGGPTVRGGVRPSGPWYLGGAYEFAKLDSNNLYRLGILQQLRAEGRYYLETSTRFTPFVAFGLGGVVYGNEFSAETAGAAAHAGLGLELEISRFALLGLILAYEPMVFAGFTDTASQRRETDVAQFLSASIVFELRSELDRR
jgi:hypothetical protein